VSTSRESHIAVPRRSSIVVIASAAGMILGACQAELAHHPINLQGLPDVATAPRIESGRPTPLSPQQQEAVVAGTTKWLKDAGSSQFGDMRGARNRRGVITVCGTVDGRNNFSRLVGQSPFIGVLQGPAAPSTFVLVDIGTTAADRAGVLSLCRQSGISGIG
jgi:hypothetical protein